MNRYQLQDLASGLPLTPDWQAPTLAAARTAAHLFASVFGPTRQYLLVSCDGPRVSEVATGAAMGTPLTS